MFRRTEFCLGDRTSPLGSFQITRSLVMLVLFGLCAFTAGRDSASAQAQVERIGSGASVQVVDDETGNPIELFSVQDRLPDKPGSKDEISWGGETSSSRGFRDGKFSVGPQYVHDGNVEFRVLSAGYLPQAVKIPVESDGTLKTKVVRMKRGAAVSGRVLDYAGKPVEGARVFARGPGMLSVENGEFSDMDRNIGRDAVKTDAEGRFSVAGLGKEASQIIVLAPRLYVWAAPAPAAGSGDEFVIRLPQPATLKVIMDIPGAVQGNEQHMATRGTRYEPAGKDAWIRVQLRTWDMDGWKGAGDFVQTRSVANPGELIFDNMTPGPYDFCRQKQFTLGDRGSGAFCDRQLDLKLSPGETKVISLVRKRGQRVSGEVRGLPQDVPGTWITVRSAEASGDPRNMVNEWKLPIFDSLTCKTGEKFRTSMLEPGKYRIIAEGYLPQARNSFASGVHLADFVGTAEVTIQDYDPATPGQPVPFVNIEIKPREQKPAK